MGSISRKARVNAARTTTYTYLGIHDNFSDKYFGLIDEAAFWSRALTAAEAKHLYLRGATRTMVQVRICANSYCSDNPAWKGPDGTDLSFFSEVNNNTAPTDYTGTVKNTRPTFTFSDYGLTLSGRYFQYRLHLESDDGALLCNYGSAENCSPEVIEVKVAPDHYPIAPTIEYNTAIPFYTFNTLSETVSCSSGVKYHLSVNGTNWYYHNGTTWVASNNSWAQSDTLSEVNSYAADFANIVGRGNLYIRALLGSTGTSTCELDILSLGGNTSF